jgi:cytochrome oxidase Cu insertion factor (SCO1/SenC/PrrC family)
VKLIGFLLLLIFSVQISAQVPAETVPAFNFFKQDKTRFTNNNLAQGKMLLFVFFDATCDHCQHAFQYMNQYHRELEKAAVYFITVDNPATATMFLNKYATNLKNKKNVTLLFDLNNEFILKFKPRKYPSIFLYSAQKKLLIYDDDEKVLPRVSNMINKRKG